MPDANAIQGNPSPPNIYPCAGAKPCNYDLNVNGTHYAIKYFAGGGNWGTNPDAVVLNEIRLIPSNKSLVVDVTVENSPGGRPPDAGWVTLFLPRFLIDSSNATSINAPFTAYDNGKPLQYYTGPSYFLEGRIEERTDVAESFATFQIDGDPSNFRAFSLGLGMGNHEIEIVGTTVAPEFPSTILIFTGILIALALGTVRFARISRFPPQ